MMERVYTNSQIYGLVTPSQEAASLGINSQTLTDTLLGLTDDPTFHQGFDNFLEMVTPHFSRLDELVAFEEQKRQELVSLTQTFRLKTGIEANLFANNTDYHPSQRYAGLRTHGYNFFIETEKGFDPKLLLPGLATLSPLIGAGVVLPRDVHEAYHTHNWFGLSPRALSIHTNSAGLYAGPRERVASLQQNDEPNFVKYSTIDNIPSPESRTLSLGIVLLMHRLAQAGVKIDIPVGSDSDVVRNFRNIALKTADWQYRVSNDYCMPALDVQRAYLSAAYKQLASGGDFMTNWIFANWQDRVEKLSKEPTQALEIPWVWKKGKLDILKQHPTLGTDNNLVRLCMSYHSLDQRNSSYTQVQQRDAKQALQEPPKAMVIKGTNTPFPVEICLRVPH